MLISGAPRTSGEGMSAGKVDGIAKLKSFGECNRPEAAIATLPIRRRRRGLHFEGIQRRRFFLPAKRAAKVPPESGLHLRCRLHRSRQVSMGDCSQRSTVVTRFLQESNTPLWRHPIWPNSWKDKRNARRRHLSESRIAPTTSRTANRMPAPIRSLRSPASRAEDIPFSPDERGHQTNPVPTPGDSRTRSIQSDA